MKKKKLKAGLFALSYRLNSLEEDCQRELEQVDLEQPTFLTTLNLSARLHCVQREIKELQEVIQKVERFL